MTQSETWIPTVEKIDGNDGDSIAYIRSLIAEGRSDEAMAELYARIENDPENSRPVMALGLTLLGKQRFEEAVVQFERAMEIDPENEAPALLAAYTGLRGNNSEYAEASFHKALQRNPNSTNALLGLSRLHLRNKNTEAAIEVIARAIEIDPEAKLLRTTMGLLLAQNNQPDEAAAQFEHILSLIPSDPQTVALLSSVYSELDRSNEAVAVVQEALKSAPNDEGLLMALGYLHVGRKEFVEAEIVLQKVIAEEGRSAGAEAATEGDTPNRPVQNFFKWLGSMAERRPRNVARLLLVQALIPQGKISEARAILADLPRTGPIAIATHRRYGDTFLAEGNKSAALESYAAALRRSDGGLDAIASIDNDPEVNSIDARIARYVEEIDSQLKNIGNPMAQASA